MHEMINMCNCFQALEAFDRYNEYLGGHIWAYSELI